MQTLCCKSSLLVDRAYLSSNTTVTLALPLRRAQQEVLRQPIFDYAGGFSPALLELSDALPFQAFLDSED